MSIIKRVHLFSGQFWTYLIKLNLQLSFDSRTRHKKVRGFRSMFYNLRQSKLQTILKAVCYSCMTQEERASKRIYKRRMRRYLLNLHWVYFCQGKRRETVMLSVEIDHVSYFSSLLQAHQQERWLQSKRGTVFLL